MITPQRLQMEKAVLQRHMPSNTYLFKDLPTDKPYVLMAAKTNSGNIYTIRIDLGQFPNSIPHAFITKMLRDKSGKPMNSTSACMHTLTSEHGYTRICHYGSNSWNPNVSIFKIYIKCRLWLEMYELHLRNGKPLDYYLCHQS